MKILRLCFKELFTLTRVLIIRAPIFLVCFSISMSAFSSSIDLPDAIIPSIEVVKSSYSSQDKLEISVSYQNVSSESVRFLKLGTALEGIISEDFLSISLDGRVVPYVGMHIKRLSPTDSDFVTIDPGQEVTGVIDIESSYAINGKGAYQILYKGGVSLPLKNGFSSNGGATLTLDENRKILLFRRTPIIDTSCSALQTDQINQALAIAEQIGLQASRALNDAPVAQRPSAARYREWFGAFDTSRYESVRLGMARIASALVNQRIGFDCTCDIPGRDRVFAFVRANDPFNMNVCPVFFRVLPSGTDSRSGTIIHEVSHFTIVAASADFDSALDQRGSRALANSSPANAIRNANAFEYFAENTPFLPMPGPLAAVDLVLDAAATSSVEAVAGSSLIASVAIENLGAEASPSTTLTLELVSESGDSLTTQASVPVVSSQRSIDFQFDFLVPEQAGQYGVEVCIQAVIGESNVANNCQTLPAITVERSPVIISPILPLLLDE